MGDSLVGGMTAISLCGDMLRRHRELLELPLGIPKHLYDNDISKQSKGGQKRKMTESQSRYSIVERLTQSKLDIISAIANLDSDSKVKKQRVESLKEDLKDLESSHKAELERAKRSVQKEIKGAERDAKNSEDKKKSKKEGYERKIKVIDEALDKIEEISKTAPSN